MIERFAEWLASLRWFTQRDRTSEAPRTLTHDPHADARALLAESMRVRPGRDPRRSSHDVLTRALGVPTSQRERDDREAFLDDVAARLLPAELLIGGTLKADGIVARETMHADKFTVALPIGGAKLQTAIELGPDGNFRITATAAIARVYELMRDDYWEASAIRRHDLRATGNLFRRLWPEITGEVDASPKAEQAAAAPAAPPE